ncbi:unnamed protein product [Onchocerca flexuosa]|uniref:Uncharacterized protein n=1 Tax=Onchocerca flexuosa TaxID=387005 RepID=A0A183HB20_9BILA|nr:unnamed protein product [Onchocerca flexuosa]
MYPLGGSRRQGKGGELDRDGSLGWSLVTGMTKLNRTGRRASRQCSALHFLPFENQKQKQPLSFKNPLSLILSAPFSIIANFVQILR